MQLSLKSLRIAVVSLILVAGLAAAAPALADDGIAPAHHWDREFYFNLGVNGYGSTAGTAGESKNETSPLMIYADVITFDQCRVYGEGSRGEYGPWTSGSSLTVNGYGLVFSWDTDKRLILRTNIKENRYTFARLTAWQSSGAGRMEGVWSPDSYEQPTDTVINAGYR